MWIKIRLGVITCQLLYGSYKGGSLGNRRGKKGRRSLGVRGTTVGIVMQ
jgi:hypothetical protein